MDIINASEPATRHQNRSQAVPIGHKAGCCPSAAPSNPKLYPSHILSLRYAMITPLPNEVTSKGLSWLGCRQIRPLERRELPDICVRLAGRTEGRRAAARLRHGICEVEFVFGFAGAFLSGYLPRNWTPLPYCPRGPRSPKAFTLPVAIEGV